VRAAKVMHGKTSPVTHTGTGVFTGLNNPLTVTRYHSLVIDPPTLPDCFEVTAWSDTQEIMGIRHREWDLEGVQFHPESILSEQGHRCWQISSIAEFCCLAVIFYAYFVIIFSQSM
jgi:para-aminobenzoate synthetase component 2